MFYTKIVTEANHLTNLLTEAIHVNRGNNVNQIIKKLSQSCLPILTSPISNWLPNNM